MGARFFVREQFEAIKNIFKHTTSLPPGLAYIPGWRDQEVFPLHWLKVDFKAGIVCLEPGTTKNREFPFTDELRAILEGKPSRAKASKKKGIITPYVFFVETQGRNRRPIGF